jgi:hypothetical protein
LKLLHFSFVLALLFFQFLDFKLCLFQTILHYLDSFNRYFCRVNSALFQGK